VPWTKHLVIQLEGIWLLQLMLLQILWELHLTMPRHKVTLEQQEDKLLQQIQWLICLLMVELTKACRTQMKAIKAVAL
jgi:hypothetical protein